MGHATTSTIYNFPYTVDFCKISTTDINEKKKTFLQYSIRHYITNFFLSFLEVKRGVRHKEFHWALYKL